MYSRIDFYADAEEAGSGAEGVCRMRVNTESNSGEVFVFSIAPVWINKILAGEKRVELRRRGPRSLKEPTAALLYATAPESALVARAIVTSIIYGSPEYLWQKVGTLSGCDEYQFFDYFKNCRDGAALYLDDVRSLDPPIFLSELKQKKWRPPFSWCRISSDHFLREVGGLTCF